MSFKKFATSIVIAAAFAASGSAMAASHASLGGPSGASGEFMSFGDVMAMKMIDKNKDGMVSKKEFMDMMTKAWDMNAKKMGVKGENMTGQQFSDLLMYLKAGG